MADRLKYRVRFSTTLDKKTVDTLKDYSQTTLIPVSKLVDLSVQEYVKNHPKKAPTD